MKNNYTKRLSWAWVILIALLSTLVTAQDLTKLKERKIDELFSKYNSKDTPGAAVVIVKDGKIIYKNTYGMADLEHNVPINTSTRFHICSLSKQFTGYAMLMLEQKGKLKLGDDIRKYLPELPEFMSKIKILNLLNHTSGLRSQDGLLAYMGIYLKDTFSNENTMEIYKRQRELNFNPGEEVEYSNAGFVLAAEIIQRVTGETLGKWINENIFKPLGMADTFVNDSDERIILNLAPSYNGSVDEKEFVKGILGSCNTGSAGIVTTIDDIAKWLIHLNYPNDEQKEIVKRLLNDDFKTSKGEWANYSYGIAVDNRDGFKVNFHVGGDAGYGAIDLFYPEFNLGIAVLSNFRPINVNSIGFNIARIFLEEKMVKEKGEVKAKEPVTSQQTVKPVEVIFSNEELKKFTGKYLSGELDTQYSILLQNDKLILSHIRHGDFPVIIIDKNTLKASPLMSKMEFIRDTAGNITGFRASGMGVRNLLFLKTKL